MTFKKTLIIGIGLIGGSFAKALRQNKLSDQIIACDLDEDSIDLAKSENIINEGFTNLKHVADELYSFDLIVVATPLSSYEEVFEQISSAKALTIDLGSIKNFKFKKSPKHFIPCHPIAGLENGGFEYSDANLFKDKKFIICKESPNTTELIKKIGAKVELLEAKKHDNIYALVSHLPQFLSFLTKEFSPNKLEGEFLQTAFRLDDSSPEIWEDIFEKNEENLEEFYIEFFDNLEDNCQKTPEEIFNLLKDVNLNNGDLENCSFEIIEKSFDKILPRLIVVLSYLQIAGLKKSLPYAGNGFKDFTSLALIANFDKEKIIDLINSNKKILQKFFKSLS